MGEADALAAGLPVALVEGEAEGETAGVADSEALAARELVTLALVLLDGTALLLACWVREAVADMALLRLPLPLPLLLPLPLPLLLPLPLPLPLPLLLGERDAVAAREVDTLPLSVEEADRLLL